MEDWLKCQISPLVKYRLNPPKMYTSVSFGTLCNQEFKSKQENGNISG